MTLFDINCSKCHTQGLANAEESDNPDIQRAGAATEDETGGLLTLLFCPKCLTGREHCIRTPLRILSAQ